MEGIYWLGGAIIVALLAIAARKNAIKWKKDDTEAKERAATAKHEHEARLAEAARIVAAEKAEKARLEKEQHDRSMERERLIFAADDVVDAEFGYDGGLRRVRKFPTATPPHVLKAVEQCKETKVYAHGTVIETGPGAETLRAMADVEAAKRLGGGSSPVAQSGWAAQQEIAQAVRASAEAEMRRPIPVPVATAAATPATVTTPAAAPLPPDLTKKLDELTRKVEDLRKQTAPPPKDEGKGGGEKRDKMAKAS